MTQERIHKLALNQALAIWGKEYDFLQEYPENKIRIKRERRAWEEVQELRKLVLADEAEK